MVVKKLDISKLYYYIVNACNSFIAILYYLADDLEPNNYYGWYLSDPISTYKLLIAKKNDSLY